MTYIDKNLQDHRIVEVGRALWRFSPAHPQVRAALTAKLGQVQFIRKLGRTDLISNLMFMKGKGVQDLAGWGKAVGKRPPLPEKRCSNLTCRMCGFHIAGVTCCKMRDTGSKSFFKI